MRICKQCEKEIIRKDKRGSFCSHSCSATYNNLRGATGRGKIYPFIPCPGCRKKIPHDKQEYCSLICRKTHKTKRWLEGENFFLRWGGTPTHIRDFLLEEIDNRCSQCGWKEINLTTGKCPLEVDHIDGDNNNNLKNNLRILCPNCHSLTPTFRNLNDKGHRKRGKRIRPEDR